MLELLVGTSSCVCICVCVCVCVCMYSYHVHGSPYRLIVYYHLEENKTPLGKIVYQCKVRGRIQLGGGDRVS